MKKLFLLLSAGVLVFQNLYAQTNTFPSSGNVGIGTTTPPSKLTLELPSSADGEFIQLNATGFGGGTTTKLLSTQLGSPRGNAKFIINHNSIDALTINSSGSIGIGTSPIWYAKLDVDGLLRLNTLVAPNALVFDNHKTTPEPTLQYMEFLQGGVRKAWVGMDGSTANNYIIKKENGGSIVLDGAIVRVNNKLIATEIEVKLNVWSDYVFADSYQLPALEEVELFIKKNKHLPDMPSEKKIITDGANVGEMLNLQMRKIEELTLYIIQQQKEIESLKHE